MLVHLSVLKPDSYHMITIENPTNTRNVVLIPNIANVQKLMSPSPKITSIYEPYFIQEGLQVYRLSVY